MKILVVDDDAVMLEAIEFQLKQEGYDVIIADNGESALQIIQKKEPLDLILTDLMMPGLSGLELLNLLKRYYLNKTPIIIISALDKTEVVLTALKAGANDFIIKPINFDELLIRVKNILNHKKISLNF